MNSTYRQVLRGYLGGWSADEESEIRTHAIDYVADAAGKYLFDADIGDPFIADQTLEDVVDGRDTPKATQFRSALVNKAGTTMHTDWVNKHGEKAYAEEQVDAALADYEEWDVNTVFTQQDDEKQVEVRIPNARTLEVIDQFSGYDGDVHLTATAEVKTDIDSEEALREELVNATPDEDSISIYPHIPFDGGHIGYRNANNDPLVIYATAYTGDLEDILSRFTL